ncbi:hypothetical protein RDI58_020817 [Solanum bulbocastanum]|uniref:Uncharacterized protein n=1 Tax=Solanum bulbocastanum TaxID=147425 RepID=A0AAN8TFY0_SOLBU
MDIRWQVKQGKQRGEGVLQQNVETTMRHQNNDEVTSRNHTDVGKAKGKQSEKGGTSNEGWQDAISRLMLIHSRFYRGKRRIQRLEEMWMDWLFLLQGMVNILSWNVRGLNGPNKQKEAENRIGGNIVAWSEVVDFHNCVVESGLLEFPAQGPRYTWSDKRANQRIFSKIDSIFINEDWLNIMPSCKAIFLPEGISDHCPAKITLSYSLMIKRFFQFCNVWAQHPQFLTIVKE